MLDHLSIVVPDLDRVAAFYDAALGALGYERQWLRDGRLRFGDRLVGDGTFLSVVEVAGAVGGGHVALRALSREAVDDFFLAALANGGTGDGGPGLRPAYHAAYYAAFVRDPCGNRLEAVCHAG